MKRNKKIFNNEQKHIPVLSFFTGGGFLDMGFEQAGFESVWTNEYNPVFAGLYAHGMTAWKKSENPNAEEKSISNAHTIEQIFAPEIIREAFPEGKPAFFGMIGGPPCPDFSTGGKNRGGKGINGRLSRTYVHRICKIKPSFFVFENVSGLYKTRIHREFLAKLERSLERCGYCLDLKILNTLDLGVPQDRERLIMAGIKKELVKKALGRTIKVSERDWFSWPINPLYNNAKSRFAWPSTEGTSSSPVLPDGVPEELTVYSIFNSGNCPSQIQNGKDMFKPYSDKFSIIKEGDTKRKSFKRLHRYRFSPTACYGHNEVHLHPWEDRRLSVREAMRIQGIPDSYVLPEDAPLSTKYTVVSNGVPVPLAREVAKSLYGFFKKGNVI